MTRETAGGTDGEGFVLRNCGDKSMAHLDAARSGAGRLGDLGDEEIIGRQKSDAVNSPIEVPAP